MNFNRSSLSYNQKRYYSVFNSELENLLGLTEDKKIQSINFSYAENLLILQMRSREGSNIKILKILLCRKSYYNEKIYNERK